jgi:hypothetical protein
LANLRQDDTDVDASDNEPVVRKIANGGKAGGKSAKAPVEKKKRERPQIINLYEFDDRGTYGENV